MVRWRGPVWLGDRIEFPPPERAGPGGLLAIGGDLSPEPLLEAYRRGIFPWPWYEDEPMLWWSPDPRFVLRPEELHVSRSIAQRVRSGRFEVRLDTAFAAVVDDLSLILDEKHKTVPDQYAAVVETCKHIGGLIKMGYRVIVTHGNGPYVGFILRRNELASPEVHSTPLDVIGADTQGSIGYMISRALDNEFKKRGISRSVAAVVTQVLVDRNDPGYKNPTKGIGGFTTKDKADVFAQEGWIVKEDAGRGWRRMIASPMPLKIVELDAIKSLIDNDFTVVAVGGGGIPVIEDEKGMLHGTYAVIDKDRASSLLASELRADLFLISTAVERVAINFNKPDQKWLERMTLSEAKKLLHRRTFPLREHGPQDRSHHRLPGS